ncbi:unnamed protein product [Microthlaspi erraticum]|uniref:Uncharacterized protein n=1 Tax=Microthlaspi erraticum TaxID=1685480 RepID=A0A6D2IDY0_9BRAS|nr:unnamed protein product [Microthlaspi erraticum]
MAPKALSTPKFQGPRENRRSISSHSTSPLSSNAFPDQRSFREILTREHKENKRITTNRLLYWSKQQGFRQLGNVNLMDEIAVMSLVW